MAKLSIPSYSLSEELISAISHGIGCLLACAGTAVGLVLAANTGDSYKIVSMAIFGFSLILLYIVSTLYHSLARNRGKKVFRVLDHCAIFFLIAGTYTPYALVTLNGPLGWTIFGVSWGATVLGIVLNAVDLTKFAKFSMICYLAQGWMIVITFNDLAQKLNPNGIILLITGGIVYTLGAVLYGVGKKVKYIHSIWHFFVLGGSILHYFSILLYVI